MSDDSGRTPLPTLDYRMPPVSGRVTFERHADGFTVTVPPIGMWPWMRWKLLVLLILLASFAAYLTVFSPETPWAIIRLLRDEPLRFILWFAFPMPLVFELPVLITLLGGYFEGRRRYVVSLRGAILTVCLEASFVERGWQSSLDELAPAVYLTGGKVMLQSKYRAFRYIVIRYGTRNEMRWLCQLVNDALAARIRAPAS